MGSEDLKNNVSDISLHKRLEIVLRVSSTTAEVEVDDKEHSNNGGAIESSYTLADTQPQIDNNLPSQEMKDNPKPAQESLLPHAQPHQCLVNSQLIPESFIRMPPENTQSKAYLSVAKCQRNRTGGSTVVNSASDTAQALRNLNEFDLGYFITKQALEGRNPASGNRITAPGDDLAGIGMRFENVTGVN
ncbi:hypothetical protein BGZ60DRAFT_528011 [Tricladium varicosporioides]|nr:hypothetical protein BGZ60DRAFT_528011 [Hymenoscyphus varicosporioides]